MTLKNAGCIITPGLQFSDSHMRHHLNNFSTRDTSAGDRESIASGCMIWIDHSGYVLVTVVPFNILQSSIYPVNVFLNLNLSHLPVSTSRCPAVPSFCWQYRE